MKKFIYSLFLLFQVINVFTMNDGWEVVGSNKSSKSKRKCRKTNRNNFTNKVSYQGSKNRNKIRSKKTIQTKTKLTQAAFDGDLDFVKNLINNGQDVNQVDREDQTALSWASGEGHLEIVKFLLNNGAEINKRDGHDYSALDWACFNKRMETINLLLTNGADIGGRRMSTLKTVAMRGDSHFEVFEILINHVMATKQYDLLKEQDEDSGRDILLWILRKHPNAPEKKHKKYDKKTFDKYFNFLVAKCVDHLNFENKDKFKKNAIYWLEKNKEERCIEYINILRECL